jgi:hypothetical protein
MSPVTYGLSDVASAAACGFAGLTFLTPIGIPARPIKVRVDSCTLLSISGALAIV